MTESDRISASELGAARQHKRQKRVDSHLKSKNRPRSLTVTLSVISTVTLSMTPMLRRMSSQKVKPCRRRALMEQGQGKTPQQGKI